AEAPRGNQVPRSLYGAEGLAEIAVDVQDDRQRPEPRRLRAQHPLSQRDRKESALDGALPLGGRKPSFGSDGNQRSGHAASRVAEPEAVVRRIEQERAPVRLRSQQGKDVLPRRRSIDAWHVRAPALSCPLLRAA